MYILASDLGREVNKYVFYSTKSDSCLIFMIFNVTNIEKVIF